VMFSSASEMHTLKRFGVEEIGLESARQSLEAAGNYILGFARATKTD